MSDMDPNEDRSDSFWASVWDVLDHSHATFSLPACSALCDDHRSRTPPDAGEVRRNRTITSTQNAIFSSSLFMSPTPPSLYGSVIPSTMLRNISRCPAHHVEAYLSVLALLALRFAPFAAALAPLSVPPSESFIGNDGPWAGFELRVGNPPQNVDVFVSTTGSETFVVVEGGCQPLDPTTCPSDRGDIFNVSASTTWDFKGNYTLSVDNNLGLTSEFDVGAYGLDDLGLGWQGSGSPTLHNQTIAGTTSTDFWIGLFGISPYPTNLSGFNADDSYPTYLQSLRTIGKIPSLTWGYTGGAQYRLKQALASLTLGGYDTSLFTPSGVSFDFGTDNNRDLTLWVQSIAYSDGTHQDVSLLPPTNPGPFLTFVDSSAPAIWLPLSACQAFETAFGLTWNSTYGYYFVNDTLHGTLTSSNPNVTFTLSNTESNGPVVNITLPYAAFDKTLGYGIGLINNLPSLQSQRYFPLQRAANNSQYTLGRTFLQGAYIITDYERRNFSVNPCIWVQGAQQNLVSICSINATGCTSPMGYGPAGTPFASNGTSPTPAPPARSSNFGTGAIVGAVIGICVLIILVLVVIFRLYRWHLEKRKEQTNLGISPTWAGHGVPEEASKPHNLVTEIDSAPVAEMGGSLRFPVQIANGSAVKLEFYSEDHQDEVHELPADAITQRHPNRSYSSRAGRHYRNGSVGQDSTVSGVSEPSEGERGSAGVRPSLSHRRNTSEQSDKSNVSDVSTLQNDGQVSPSVSFGISPIRASPLQEAQNPMLHSSSRPGMPPADVESPTGFGGVSPIAERPRSEILPLSSRLQASPLEPRGNSTQLPPTAGSDADGT